MPQLKIYIGTAGAETARNATMIDYDKNDAPKNLAKWSARLASASESVTKGDSVLIKRQISGGNETTVFAGILEVDNPTFSGGGAYREVSGRHIAVKLWRKWAERHDIQDGFWSGAYPNKVIEFMLRPTKSDLPQLDVIDNKNEGWGMDPTPLGGTAWDITAINDAGETYDPQPLADRGTDNFWVSDNSGGTPTQDGVGIKIDFGSAKTISGIVIVGGGGNTTQDQAYLRSYGITYSTNDIDYTNFCPEKAHNVASTIVESATPVSVRYIKIVGVTDYGEIEVAIRRLYIYESDGAIDGISVGTITESMPLNATLLASDADATDTTIDVYDGWKFYYEAATTGSDTLILQDSAGTEAGIRVTGIAYDTPSAGIDRLTLASAIVNSYTVARGAVALNLDSDETTNTKPSRRLDIIDRMVKLCNYDSLTDSINDKEFIWEITDAGVVNTGYVYNVAGTITQVGVGTDRSASIAFQTGVNIISSNKKDDDRNKVDRIKVIGQGYDSTSESWIISDWVGSGEYEYVHEDKGITSKVEATALAHSLQAKFNTDLITITVEANDTYDHDSTPWDINDTITITDTIISISAKYQIKSVSRNYTSKGEKVTIVANFRAVNTADYMIAVADNTVHSQPNAVTTQNATNFTYTGGVQDYLFFIEAEQLVLDSDATIVYDSGASNTRYVHMAQAESGNILRGPKIELLPGTYQMYAKMRVSAVSPSAILVKMGGWSDSKSGNWLGSRTFTTGKWLNADEWQIMTATFKVKIGSEKDVEFKISSFITGIADLDIDYIGIKIVDVLDMPVGPPDQVLNTAVTNKFAGLTITWDDVVYSDAYSETLPALDLAHYKVYRKAGGAPSQVSGDYLGTSNSTSFTDIPPDYSVYHYGIAAVDWVGNEGTMSATASGTKTTAGNSDVDEITEDWVNIELQTWQSNFSVVKDAAYNAVKWGILGNEGVGNGTVTFQDDSTKGLSAGSVSGMTAGLTYWVYWTAGGSTYTVSISSDIADATGSGIGVLALVVVDDNTDQGDPSIVMFNSYAPTISAGIIVANSIFATHIKAGEIKADKLDSTLVLSTTIATAASPDPRIEMKSGGIIAYTDATTKTFELETSSGQVKVYGSNGAFQIWKGDASAKLGELRGASSTLSIQGSDGTIIAITTEDGASLTLNDDAAGDAVLAAGSSGIIQLKSDLTPGGTNAKLGTSGAPFLEANVTTVNVSTLDASTKVKGNHYSSDDSQGLTNTYDPAALATMVFKDGLLTGVTYI
jgi:hypothetical protein